jgi:RecA-family ATPase
MQATAYPATHWLIPGLIADGLTILGGSPKSGKSYLAYALALAVCRPALWCQEWHAEEGTVTFVSLEDDEADSAERLRQLAPGVHLPPGRLRFIHGAEHVPSFDEGLLPWVEAMLQAHAPRLLVIDPISYLYVLKRTGGQFEETKDMLFPLRWLGKQYRCAIVCVDHRRKRSRDDVSIFDTLHGSVAKLAVADALLMVERDDSEITVAALVRKGKDQTLHLTLTFEQDTATLAYSGDSGMKTTSYGLLRQQVYTVLMNHRSPLGLEDIVTLLGIADSRATRDAVRKTLLRGYHANEIERTARNQYLIAQREN